MRCTSSHAPKQWVNWIPTAESWFNTTFHTALGTSPYTAVYGLEPPIINLSQWGSTNIAQVEEMIQERKNQIEMIRGSLEKAQARMKHFADTNRTKRSFKVGEMEYLKLQPYRQGTIAMRKNIKLSSKFYGPFQIIEKIGPVAYRLELPNTSRIHPVFHVSQLKKHVGSTITLQPTLPSVKNQGVIEISPLRVLEHRTVLRNEGQVSQHLIHWKNSSIDEATWEDEELLQHNFPDFNLYP